jgi:hypothetical protein
MASGVSQNMVRGSVTLPGYSLGGLYSGGQGWVRPRGTVGSGLKSLEPQTLSGLFDLNQKAERLCPVHSGAAARRG